MALKTIYIARHGFRANWLPEPHPPNPTGIDSDPPLAPHGLNQALELAHYLLSIEPKPAKIFTSPFYRCLQTATPVAEVMNLDIEVERGIGEWYKPDRAVVPQPASVLVLQGFFPRLQARWDGAGVVPSAGGETEEMVFARSAAFLEAFIPKFEAEYPEAEAVLFVTHAAAAIALGMALLGYSGVRDYLDDEGTILRAGSCSLTQYTREADQWDLTMNGNTEFLSKGEEMNWNFHNGFEAGSDDDVKLRREKQAREKEDYEHVYVTLELPLKVALTNDEAGLVDGSQPGLLSHPQSNRPHRSFPLTSTRGQANLQRERDAEEEPEEAPPKKARAVTSGSTHLHGDALDPSFFLQVTGLVRSPTDPNLDPLVNIGNTVYRGRWETLVGTELMCEDKGDVVGLVHQTLRLVPGELKTHKELELEHDEDDEGVEGVEREETREQEGQTEGGSETKPKTKTKVKVKKLTLREKVLEAIRVVETGKDRALTEAVVKTEALVTESSAEARVKTPEEETLL